VRWALVLLACGFSKNPSPDLSSTDLSSIDLPLIDLSSIDLSLSSPLPDLTPPPLRVFVTSAVYNGLIDNNAHGVLEADLKCSLLGGGSFRAWLSDSSHRAPDRVLGPGPWARSDGKIAFPGRPTFGPLFPVNLDENGKPVEADARVWTGTDGGPGNPLATCIDWSSPSSIDPGTYGDADYTSYGWTNAANQQCNLAAHLYCFEQN
jgi:hypothetical protein